MRVGRLDEPALVASEPDSYGGPVAGTRERMQLQWLIACPQATVGYEAFAPHATVSWAFWHSEVHIILGGRAEVTYTLAPNHRQVVTRVYTAGDVYLIPQGARLVTTVLSDEPYVHWCVIIPRVPHSAEELADTYD